MDANQRLDYFRSEIKGEVAKLEKRIQDQQTENLKTLREFEKKLDALSRELHNVELQAR